MGIGICHQVSLPGEWADAIATAGTLGVDGIELFVRQSDVPSFLESQSAAHEVKALAERHDLAISSLCLVFLMRGDVVLHHADLDVRHDAVDLAKKALRRAANVGAGVVLVGAFLPDDPAASDNYVTSLQDLARTAHDLGVRIGVESGLAAAAQLALLDRIGSPAVVGDYFDIGNVAGRNMDPVEETRLRAGRITQVHVKGVSGAGLDAGTVDLAGVNRELKAANYNGWLLLETSAGDDPVGNARRNVAILKEAFA